MRAIKVADYEKYGCVKCGCNYAYSDGYFGTEASLICGECGEKFVILNNLAKTSSVGFGKEGFQGITIPKENTKTAESLLNWISQTDFSKPEIQEKLANGIGIEKDGFVYLLVTPHPREGIPSHDLVIPDLRPEEKNGDFCYPRGVGYDLACFVKSKQAGERITEMINRVVKDYTNETFCCHLDYREDEPLWIQVKIDYQSELRAELLAKLIEENDNVITEAIVRNTLNQKFEDLPRILSEHNQKTKVKKK